MLAKLLADAERKRDPTRKARPNLRIALSKMELTGARKCANVDRTAKELIDNAEKDTIARFSTA